MFVQYIVIVLFNKVTKLTFQKMNVSIENTRYILFYEFRKGNDDVVVI